MRLSAARVLSLAALLLLVALPAAAQEDEEGRFSLGLGGGLVQTGGSSDPYLTANLRMRIGYRVAGEERQGSVYGFLEPEVGYRTRDNDITAAGVRQGTLHIKDTLVGVNVGGTVRLRVFEYFVAGGVGYHFVNQDVQGIVDAKSFDSGNVGVNAQFGFDVRVSELISLFGVGRFDLVQESDKQKALRRQLSLNSEEQQTKVFLGLRVHL